MSITPEAIAAAKRFHDFWKILDDEAASLGRVSFSQGEASAAWNTMMGHHILAVREGPLTREEWERRRASRNHSDTRIA